MTFLHWVMAEIVKLIDHDLQALAAVLSDTGLLRSSAGRTPVSEAASHPLNFDDAGHWPR